MPFWLDKLIEEDPRARLIWEIQFALGGKFVTRDRTGQKKIQHYLNGMEGWWQRLDQSPVKVRVHLGFGWFTDQEWTKSPEKCFQEAEKQTLVIALGEVGIIYATRAGMEEAELVEGLEEGTMGWEQTTPDCRMEVCYRSLKLNNGKYSVGWYGSHRYAKGGVR